MPEPNVAPRSDRPFLEMAIIGPLESKRSRTVIKSLSHEDDPSKIQATSSHWFQSRFGQGDRDHNEHHFLPSDNNILVRVKKEHLVCIWPSDSDPIPRIVSDTLRKRMYCIHYI